MKTVYAHEYQILPDTGLDYSKTFQEMFSQNACDTIFILEHGRYDFRQKNAIEAKYYLSNSDVVEHQNLAVLMQKMHNIVLDAGGSEFIFHGQIMPITFDACVNAELRDLTIDWDIPLTAEGVVVSSCESYVDISIDAGLYPFEVRENILYFSGEDWAAPIWNQGHTEFDINTKKVALCKGDTFPKTWQEQLSNGLVRFYGEFTNAPAVGNVIVLRHSERIHAGVFINDSSDVLVRNTTIHCTGGLGILAQFSENLRFSGINMIPNKKRGRLFACGHDDGIHLSCNMGEITVENCYFHGLLDDPLNIHGIAAKIIGNPNSKTLRCKFCHPQAIGFDKWARQGHKIRVLNAKESMNCIGEFTVKDFELIAPEIFEICSETDLPNIAFDDCALENLTTNAALTCRNNLFGSCRARGILVTTSKPVLIENNIFESAGAAILIAGDANYWYESGACRNVVIRDNHFADCCLTSSYLGGNAVISIHPETMLPSTENAFHQNIVITSNSFHVADIPILHALSTSQITFCNNRIIRSYIHNPWNKQNSILEFAYCSNVFIKNNTYTGEMLNKVISCIGMSFEDVTNADTRLTAQFT